MTSIVGLKKPPLCRECAAVQQVLVLLLLLVPEYGCSPYAGRLERVGVVVACLGLLPWLLLAGYRPGTEHRKRGEVSTR